jgi:formate dehydrogenase major subunit
VVNWFTIAATGSSTSKAIRPRRSRGRVTKVKYRAPRSRKWIELDHASAMDMVAERVWATRERTFDETAMHTTGIAHLGGATLDVEENYLIKKLFTAGLGMVCLSNQARI